MLSLLQRAQVNGDDAYEAGTVSEAAVLAPWPPWRRPHTKLVVATCIAAYCAAAVLVYWPVSPFSSTSIPGGSTGDPVQMVWFLAWFPFALLHGHSFFFSNYLAYPTGVNLASNTSVPLLGLLGAPVTLILGPVATFNFLLRLAFACSATSMFVVLRTWTRSSACAFVGGLVYGFSAYMASEGHNHLDLIFLPVPPLLFWLLYDLVVTHKMRPRRAGLAVGLLAAAQAYTDMEVLAGCALIAALGVAAFALLRGRAAIDDLRAAAPGAVVAVALFALIGGPWVWFFLEGTQHVTGTTQPLWFDSGFHADLLGPVRRAIPEYTRLPNGQLFRLDDTAFVWSSSDGYLGAPLVLLAVAVSIWRRREPIVRSAALLGATVFILSLGSDLSVNGHLTHIWLPEALISHLPVVDNLLPVRLSLFVAMFAAILVAIGLDRAASQLRRGVVIRRPPMPPGDPESIGGRRSLSNALCTVGALVVGVAVMLPIVSMFPIPSQPAQSAPVLTRSLEHSVPPGGVVLMIPYTASPTDQPMLWQAESQMKFRLVGGYAIVPTSGGMAALRPDPTAAYTELLDERLFLIGTAFLPLSPTALDLARRMCSDLEVLPTLISQYRLDAIVVWQDDTYGIRTDALFSAALGRPSVTIGSDVVAWYHLEQRKVSGICSAQRIQRLEQGGL